MNNKIFSIEGKNVICVADTINYEAPFFEKKLEIIENKISKQISNDKSILNYVDETNYKNVINDLEIESFFCELFLKNIIKFPYKIKFLFLLSISEQGYNFGQFRIMSHLIKLGYSIDNFILFPLTISKNEYIYDKTKLKNILLNNKRLYICQTAYIGWEKQLKTINQYIKLYGNHIIMTGGPLTLSHLQHCCKNLGTDIVITGQGEYIFESFLKEVYLQNNMFPKISIPHIIYTKESNNYKPTNLINKYIDFLYWDLDLLYELYKLVPVINLFTSEECRGNCVFCYRYTYHDSNTITNDVLLEWLSKIVDYFSHREEKTIYIRFFDDDFFAATQRDSAFLLQLNEVLGEQFKIFELTFSIRSIYRLYRSEGDRIFNILSKLDLKRVTIGVDGFNNEDLKFLQKGYPIEKVFEIASKFKQHNINVLMYCILTMPSTNYCNLFDSLLNMLSLVVMGNVYIGPTITPNIYVQNANHKLFPKFKGTEVKYLEIESLSDSVTNISNIHNSIMSAKVLSYDYIVRNFNREIGLPTSKESAYIIPLLCAYMKVLAKEYIRLNTLSIQNNNSLKVLCKREIALINQHIECLKKTIVLYNDDQIKQINELLSLELKIDELEEVSETVMSKEKTVKKIRNINKIIEIYYYFICYIDRTKQKRDKSILVSNIERLISLPLKVFIQTVGDVYKNEIIKTAINNIKCFVSEDEYWMFKKYIERVNDEV